MSSKLKWNEQEEEWLKKLSCIEAERKWVMVANQLNKLFPERQRTSKQCREKYINHLQYGQGAENNKWSLEEQRVLFQHYLQKGSQWKLISTVISGKSENAVKNKFYGKIRKLVRKLNAICKERINRSNKPLRDQSIMRIIDVEEGFENLPEHLMEESKELKLELLDLTQKDLDNFGCWNLLDQNNVVLLIKKIHKFNINSRYYCSRKRKSIPQRKSTLQSYQTAVEDPNIQMQIKLVEQIQAQVQRQDGRPQFYLKYEEQSEGIKMLPVAMETPIAH